MQRFHGVDTDMSKKKDFLHEKKYHFPKETHFTVEDERHDCRDISRKSSIQGTGNFLSMIHEA